MRMGIVLQRRRQRQKLLLRRRLAIVMIVALLGAAAMSDGLRKKLRSAMEESVRTAQVFAGGQEAQKELTLQQKEVCALQLGVFDSGERAADEARRLEQEGVACMIWQREKMRIVSSVARSRDALDWEGAGGHEAYVISDALEEVSIRITAHADTLDEVCMLLALPDQLLDQLLEPGQVHLPEMIQRTRELAMGAQNTHPENTLYTQLVQSLLNWCTLMEQRPTDTRSAVSYAQVTMYVLCRELRAAIDLQTNAESTASAQRTPSTAADVMPPA